MIAFRSKFFIAILIGLLAPLAAAKAQSRSPNPHTILNDMISQYDKLSSYEDSGEIRVVASISPIAGGAQVFTIAAISLADEPLVSFKTYFASPEMFRFQWKSSSSRTTRDAVVWRLGKQIFSWKPSPVSPDRFELSGSTNLGLHIDEAIRASSGAAFLVPTLLMKEASYDPASAMLRRVTELSFLREEQFEESLCYVISGKMSGTPWTLWIDQKTHLLRKTRTSYSAGSFHEKMQGRRGKQFFAEEIHRDIRFNHKIDDAVFKYRPKIGRKDVDYTH